MVEMKKKITKNSEVSNPLKNISQNQQQLYLEVAGHGLF
jgi:hypothetical protein